MHPRAPFLGKARALVFSAPEEAQGCRRPASRSARFSDAVLRSAINAGDAGSPALQERGRAEMDCRDRAVRRLRLRHPRVQLRPLRGAQERDRLGLSRVESQGGWLRELWLRHGRTQRPAASPNGDRDSARPDSLIGPHPCRHLVGSLPRRRCRRRAGRAGGTCRGDDRRSAVVDRGLEGGAGQMNTTTEARARRVAYRTRGHSHGSITRLVSPSDVGRLIKPYVVLDYFDMDPEHTPPISFHPHSGIATLTVLLKGRIPYEETPGTKGIIPAGRRRRQG